MHYEQAVHLITTRRTGRGSAVMHAVTHDAAIAAGTLLYPASTRQVPGCSAGRVLHTAVHDTSVSQHCMLSTTGCDCTPLVERC